MLQTRCARRNVCHPVGRFGTGGIPCAFRIPAPSWIVRPDARGPSARRGSACSPRSDSPPQSIRPGAGSPRARPDDRTAPSRMSTLRAISCQRRSAIEQAWYALHIGMDPAPFTRAEIWLRRNETEQTRTACKRTGRTSLSLGQPGNGSHSGFVSPPPRSFAAAACSATVTRPVTPGHSACPTVEPPRNTRRIPSNSRCGGTRPLPPNLTGNDLPRLSRFQGFIQEMAFAASRLRRFSAPLSSGL